jgi:hypothetical protein
MSSHHHPQRSQRASIPAIGWTSSIRSQRSEVAITFHLWPVTRQMRASRAMANNYYCLYQFHWM